MSQTSCTRLVKVFIDVALKMTSAHVVEMSVTNNSSSQNYPHPDDHALQTINGTACLLPAKPMCIEQRVPLLPHVKIGRGGASNQ